MNKFLLILIAAIISALVSFGTFKVMESKYEPETIVDSTGQTHVRYVVRHNIGTNEFPDFVNAAKEVTPTVVHIKVKLSQQNGYGRQTPGYFGAPQAAVPVMASGSGVIISNNGFIVTNNHVVEDATDIEVVLLDKRVFKANLIGRDPNTDLALIKINASGLPTAKIGNSDQVNIGQWVLAVGFPFSLSTTVTAGIVSATERSIGIISQHEQQQNRQAMNSAVEAYIQTDAAINPGNSGGALINTKGELIGINAAIASQTGGYEGYGFAIPVNLAKKVVDDLRKYGTVKRGFLGVSFPTPATEDQVLAQQGIKPGSVNGVYITGVQTGSAAAAAGLKQGDIIKRIDSTDVTSSVELSERVARHHPNDKIQLTYQRGNQTQKTTATLQGQSSETLASNKQPAVSDIYQKLGARFAPLSSAIKQHYQVNSGIVVTDVAADGFFGQIGIQSGSIITSINGHQINNPNDLNAALTATTGTLRIDCINPDGSRIVFNLSLGA